MRLENSNNRATLRARLQQSVRKEAKDTDTTGDK